jgi:lysophospholipase L1-like esterase
MRAMFQRYVALGDSTTEGLEDPYPGGGYRGWADRLAARLAEIDPGVLYANLGIRGRKLGQVRAEQLEPALAMEPDLVSIVGGVNDVLRPRADVHRLAADLEAMVEPLRASGATVLLMTYPDVAEVMAAARRVTPRIHAFNDHIRVIAARHGARVMDLADAGPMDARFFHADRLHANALGHERIALAAAAALDLPDAVREADPLPPAPPRTRAQALREDAAWAQAHLAPWVGRRLRGVSSGDGREPKRPVLAPVRAG